MKRYFERLKKRTLGWHEYFSRTRFVILCGVIAAAAVSCSLGAGLLGPERRAPNTDIPLPRTSRVIQEVPTLMVQAQATTTRTTPQTEQPETIVEESIPTTESNPRQSEELSQLRRPTATALPPAMEPYLGIWLSRAELDNLPTSGMAWENLREAADQDPGEPDLSDQDQPNNVLVLAKALVYARTGESKYRDEVVDNLMAAIGTERDGRTLALGRELVAYVIAADLINLPQDLEEDQLFREWLREVLIEPLEQERTLQMTHEIRPNNWGTHAGASRVAVAIYLGDEQELDRAARVFKGYLGDREIYSDFEFGKLWWHADRKNPVGINPKGAILDGHSVDGALTEEMRRGGKVEWPPKETGYAWEALQGALVQAQLLHRAGYAAWEWEDRALLRAVQFLYSIGWEPEGDDVWQPWLINHAYGTDYGTTTPTRPGKNMGWTDWTHADYRDSERAQTAPKSE